MAVVPLMTDEGVVFLLLDRRASRLLCLPLVAPGNGGMVTNVRMWDSGVFNLSHTDFPSEGCRESSRPAEWPSRSVQRALIQV